MAPNATPDVSPEQLDAVLKFLPIFESKEFSCGEWVVRKGYMPHFRYDPDVDGFVLALYQQHIVLQFDWVSWKDEAKRYMASPDSLAEADLLTIRKLLTTHHRADRFVEGHLGQIFESGHIVEILRRLKAIREREV